MNHQDIDESNIKLTNWTPEREDAQAVAKAVNNRTLNTDIGPYNKFLEANQTIKNKYGHYLKKGRRNVRNNILKLVKCINHYNDNQPDLLTGNREYSSICFLSFLTQAVPHTHSPSCFRLFYLNGMFRAKLRFFERFDRGARVTRVTMHTARYLATRKILKIFLRIEIENYHIIMTMGMYRIEPPWVSI
jgi:hypothetical protein